jgi:hypothetical protein
MSQQPLAQLTPVQQTILAAVCAYPGQFSRSGLAKMLVGAKSWEDKDYPEYGRLSQYRRKDVGYQVEILLQQGHIELDGRNRLIPVSSSGRVG